MEKKKSNIDEDLFGSDSNNEEKKVDDDKKMELEWKCKYIIVYTLLKVKFYTKYFIFNDLKLK